MCIWRRGLNLAPIASPSLEQTHRVASYAVHSITHVSVCAMFITLMAALWAGIRCIRPFVLRVAPFVELVASMALSRMSLMRSPLLRRSPPSAATPWTLFGRPLLMVLLLLQLLDIRWLTTI